MKQGAYPTNPILLVDDEETWLRSFSLALRSGGMDNVITVTDAGEVAAVLAETEVEVIAADLAMPGMSGEELIEQVRATHPDIPVLVVTGMSQVEAAVRCIKLGAFDFLVKTYDKSSLVSGIRHAIEIRELRRENASLRSRFLQDSLEHPEAFEHIVAAGKSMRLIFQYVETIAGSSRPVLVTGESGVGKELIAQAVHDLSGREGEFVPVNVAGLDDNIFADTLFGHRKGAFTGANQSRSGLVENAKGGTLFLDEIGDLSHSSQLKLLRLVQEREYLPIGSDLTRKTDARIIAATNADLPAPDDGNRFRSDLYYRLRAHHIHIPPLRERKEDLPLLVDRFVRDACKEERRRILEIPADLLPLLATYDFPGNVRELRFLIFDAVRASTGSTLSMEQVRKSLGPAGRKRIPKAPGDDAMVTFGSELPTLKEVCAELVDEAMRRTGGNQSMAAMLLGVSRQALNKRINTAKKSGGED